MEAVDENNIYFTKQNATGIPKGIYKSSDGGDSWDYPSSWSTYEELHSVSHIEGNSFIFSGRNVWKTKIILLQGKIFENQDGKRRLTSVIPYWKRLLRS